MRRCVPSACALGFIACSTPAPSARIEPATVRTPSGATITLPIDVATEHTTRGTSDAFRSADAFVWSVQLRGRADGVEGTLDEIAVALCRRVELAEVEGELTHRDCAFAGQPAQCIEGWQSNGRGERIVRRGAIVRAGSEVAWISLAAREGASRIDERAERLATHATIVGAP